MAFLILILFVSLVVLRPWDLFPELAPYRIGFWIGNLGLVASMVSLAMRIRELVRVPELQMLAAFVAVLVISPAIAQGWAGGVVEAFTNFMPAFVGCVLILLTVDSPGKLRAVAAVLLLCAAVLVVEVIAAFHFGWKEELFVLAQRTQEFDAFGERVSFGRARALGFLNDPNDLAQFLITVAPWLWPAWRRGGAFRNICFVILPSLLMLYGVMLTRSRGGVLSIMVIAMLRLREKMPRFRNAGAVVVAGGAGLAMLALGVTGGRDISAEDASAGGRLDAWSAGLAMLRSNPFTGVGFGGFVDHHERVAHNSFVHCFAELGMVGYFFWIALLVLIHSRLSALSGLEPEDKESATLAAWGTALRFSLCGFLTGAFFLSRTYTPTLYLIVGLAIALHLIAERAGYHGRTAGVFALYARSVAMVCASVVGIYLLVRVM